MILAHGTRNCVSELQSILPCRQGSVLCLSVNSSQYFWKCFIHAVAETVICPPCCAGCHCVNAPCLSSCYCQSTPVVGVLSLRPCEQRCHQYFSICIYISFNIGTLLKYRPKGRPLHESTYIKGRRQPNVPGPSDNPYCLGRHI